MVARKRFSIFMGTLSNDQNDKVSGQYVSFYTREAGINADIDHLQSYNSAKQRFLQVGKKAIITVDIGTTSSRACLYDACGQVLHMAQRENLPVFFDDGRVEQDPQQWLQVLLETLTSCADAARTPRGRAPGLGQRGGRSAQQAAGGGGGG